MNRRYSTSVLPGVDNEQGSFYSGFAWTVVILLRFRLELTINRSYST